MIDYSKIFCNKKFAKRKYNRPEKLVSVKRIQILCNQHGIDILDKTWGNCFEKTGRADLTCIQKTTGKRVEIEAKSRNGKRTKKQSDWLIRNKKNRGI